MLGYLVDVDFSIVGSVLRQKRKVFLDVIEDNKNQLLLDNLADLHAGVLLVLVRHQDYVFLFRHQGPVVCVCRSVCHSRAAQVFVLELPVQVHQ